MLEAEKVVSIGAGEPLCAWGSNGRRDKALAWCGRGPCRVMASSFRLVRVPLAVPVAASSVAASRG